MAGTNIEGGKGRGEGGAAEAVEGRGIGREERSGEERRSSGESGEWRSPKEKRRMPAFWA
eukprot:765752-Hanusia_phi.AAC.1